MALKALRAVSRDLTVDCGAVANGLPSVAAAAAAELVIYRDRRPDSSASSGARKVVAAKFINSGTAMNTNQPNVTINRYDSTGTLVGAVYSAVNLTASLAAWKTQDLGAPSATYQFLNPGDVLTVKFQSVASAAVLAQGWAIDLDVDPTP